MRAAVSPVSAAEEGHQPRRTHSALGADLPLVMSRRPRRRRLRHAPNRVRDHQRLQEQERGRCSSAKQ